jgi:hypothetical protein
MKCTVVRSLITTSIVLFCASCTSVPPPEPPVKPGMAQIILHRSGNQILEGMATVEINGSDTINLFITSKIYTSDITPGPTVIAAYNYVIPGRYVLKFTAVAGKVYHFRVAPRGETVGIQGSDFTVTEMSGMYQIVGN